MMKSTASEPRAKIKDLGELAGITATLRAEGRRVVHCHGVFDLLHVGHIRHFEQAKLMGDVLVVTLTPDEHVNKGPNRPAFTHALRAEMIAALNVVDYVAVNRWPMSVETIALLRPHVYVKGPDYRNAQRDVTGGISREAEAVQAAGGEIRFTEDITFSSSTLLNQHFSPFTEDVDRYLEDFRRRHSEDEVMGWLDKASRLKPLVIGEAIIDEYVFCEGIGKSTKDPVLAVLLESVTTQAGGTLAIANHLAGICESVCLITMLGDRERREDLVRSALAPNVQPTLLTKSHSPTLHKRRFVDRYSGNKLFEVYVMEDAPVQGGDEDALLDALAARLAWCDLAIVADYGHGTMTPPVIGKVCADAPFLAVNVQSNAGNRGFNPVSKYRRADYVCLAKHEITMETRQRHSGLRENVLEVARRVDCQRFTVTKGKDGTLHYDVGEGFAEAPALASRVLDRVGAGDAVLAVTSLLVRTGAPWSIVAFLGNVAGAALVAELGNRVPIGRVGFSKHISALMK